MCSEGVARDWGTLALPLAASKGQKVGGVPLGDLVSGTKSESVSHPNTKLQREWQWAKITTACTSSASDQHCSPAFSSVWRKQKQKLRVKEQSIISRFSFRFICICVYVHFVTCGSSVFCCTWMCEQAVSHGWWASTLLMWSRRRRRGGAASKPCNHRGSPPTLRNWAECRYTR